MSLEHLVHATATLSEIGAAISIGLLTKIISPSSTPDALEDSSNEVRAREAKLCDDLKDTGRRFLAEMVRISYNFDRHMERCKIFFKSCLKWCVKNFAAFTLFFSLFSIIASGFGLELLSSAEYSQSLWFATSLISFIISLCMAFNIRYLHSSDGDREEEVSVPFEPI